MEVPQGGSSDLATRPSPRLDLGAPDALRRVDEPGSSSSRREFIVVISGSVMTLRQQEANPSRQRHDERRQTPKPQPLDCRGYPRRLPMARAASDGRPPAAS